MDKFPNDKLEVAILIVAVLGVIGGLSSLWYMVQQVPQ